MEPISVAIRRGQFEESLHAVHAVAVQDGAVIAEAGEPALSASLRSAAKPIQALSLARARGDLDLVDLAIASSSHRAEPEQLAAVRRLLAKAGAGEEDLECGEQAGRPPGALHHNCSGKHAGMLATCAARGWPALGYRLAGHPLQEQILGDVAAAAEVDPGEVGTGIDGCGVVCFALPLERVAFSFSRLEELEAGERIAAALRAHPRLVGGTGSADTELMERLPAWLAKGGAEGLLCASGPGGVGVALKVADGNGRALRPALAEFLSRLGVTIEGFGTIPLENSHGELVGEVAKR